MGDPLLLPRLPRLPSPILLFSFGHTFGKVPSSNNRRSKRRLTICGSIPNSMFLKDDCTQEYGSIPCDIIRTMQKD